MLKADSKAAACSKTVVNTKAALRRCVKTSGYIWNSIRVTYTILAIYYCTVVLYSVPSMQIFCTSSDMPSVEPIC